MGERGKGKGLSARGGGVHQGRTSSPRTDELAVGEPLALYGSHRRVASHDASALFSAFGPATGGCVRRRCVFVSKKMDFLQFKKM